ncbi:hypothetical protein ccbrp13_61150 [Ktedonobacteria bacterium brp13]|nr:hypothetical protein ccbrp13_61150 [Ktedonobacteria bacterium brp13]
MVLAIASKASLVSQPYAASENSNDHRKGTGEVECVGSEPSEPVHGHPYAVKAMVAMSMQWAYRE